MTPESAIRWTMNLCIVATLATLFLAIVFTPVILLIGFAGKFWPVWSGIAAHPIWAAVALIAFMALAMAWIWLMLAIGAALRCEN